MIMFASVNICCGVAGKNTGLSQCMIMCHARHVITFGECVKLFFEQIMPF